MYSVANLSILIWAETSNTWHFCVILQRAWRSLVKLEVSYAWLVLLTFLASVLMILNELMAVKRSSASRVPFKWHSTWTIYRVSNFTEFKTTIPLRKTLNIREHLSTNTGRQSERCFGNDIGNFQFVMVILTQVTLFWTYRKFKLESSIKNGKG